MVCNKLSSAKRRATCSDACHYAYLFDSYNIPSFEAFISYDMLFIVLTRQILFGRGFKMIRLEIMHPADQLATFMTRIYNNGLTTSSGGNLSILDSNGHVWITPTGLDKGILNRNDMVQVAADGPVTKHVLPSTELPFHQAIYKSRSNIRAVLHAHSPALIAFAMMRELPEVHLMPVTRISCGNISMAPYARMGSSELGAVLAEAFKKGVNAVLMENHGIVVAAESMQRAYAIFETLEISARIELMARRLGKPRVLTEDEIDIARTKEHTRMSELTPRARTPEELGLRRDMTRMLQRAVDQNLFSASQGTISARMSDGSYLISPFGRDRREIEPEDLVLVRRGLKESGKTPSRAVFIHEMIYHRNPNRPGDHQCPTAAHHGFHTDRSVDRRRFTSRTLRATS